MIVDCGAHRTNMKLFHISDVLSVTTGRLVSSRHMEGVYEILSFLTSDTLFTHQLPRAFRECEPWIRSQFPNLMEDSPGMSERLAAMDAQIKTANGDKSEISKVTDAWVEKLRQELGLSEMLPVYELGADMHTHIDPVEEAKAMMGDENVMEIDTGNDC